MAVTDLTGTKWFFNSEIDFSGLDIYPSVVTYNISFNCEGVNYIRLECGLLDELYYWDSSEQQNIVYEGRKAWLSEAYRTIEITGGTDATNTDLIAWLQANATQVVEPAITDLTGTKWRFNDTITATSGYGIFDLYAEDSEQGEVWNTLYIGYKFSMMDQNPSPLANSAVWMPYIYLPAGEFTITGGTAVTNSDLISWLQANATQITEPSNTFSIGNLPIENVYFGTQQVKKVYLGNTLVWEKEETGYTVTLNCGGGSSYTKGSVHVYDSTYADRSSSNLIFSQDSIDLSAYPVTLTVKSGHCTIIIEAQNLMSPYIESSDFTEPDVGGTSLGIYKEYVVDKNGTIEFGATDWDD